MYVGGKSVPSEKAAGNPPVRSSYSSEEVAAVRRALSCIPLPIERTLDLHREIGRSAGLLQSDALAAFPDVLQVRLLLIDFECVSVCVCVVVFDHIIDI